MFENLWFAPFVDASPLIVIEFLFNAYWILGGCLWGFWVVLVVLGWGDCGLVLCVCWLVMGAYGFATMCLWVNN